MKIKLLQLSFHCTLKHLEEKTHPLNSHHHHQTEWRENYIGKKRKRNPEHKD
jgi:hypothetical protein